MRKIIPILLPLFFCFTEMNYATLYLTNIPDTKKIIVEKNQNITDTTYRVFTNPDKTYGYEIMVNNKKLIRQNTIPGQPGMQGFKKRKDADQVALLVIKKLQSGIMPPTINKEELIQLNIIF